MDLRIDTCADMSSGAPVARLKEECVGAENEPGQVVKVVRPGRVVGEPLRRRLRTCLYKSLLLVYTHGLYTWCGAVGDLGVPWQSAQQFSGVDA